MPLPDSARRFDIITDEMRLLLLELNTVRNRLAHPPASWPSADEQVIKYKGRCGVFGGLVSTDAAKSEETCEFFMRKMRPPGTQQEIRDASRGVSRHDGSDSEASDGRRLTAYS